MAEPSDFDAEEEAVPKSRSLKDWTGAFIVAAGLTLFLTILMPYRLSKVFLPEVLIGVFVAFAIFPPEHTGFSLRSLRKAGLIAAVAWTAALTHGWIVTLFAPRA